MVVFSPVTEDDLGTIKEIYDHYILTTTATFHGETIPVHELKEFLFVAHPKYPSFVLRENNEIIGFCYLTQYRKRQAWDRTAELSIYLKPECTGNGIGVVALNRLEDAARQSGIRVLVGTLCGENGASIRLMEKCGSTRCAHLKNVGEKFGRVLDVVIYQKEI